MLTVAIIIAGTFGLFIAVHSIHQALRYLMRNCADLSDQ